MKREDRLNFIAQFIRENEIKTQEELVNTLLTHGIDVTQATVSRDIKSLALIKVPAEIWCVIVMIYQKTRKFYSQAFKKP